MSFPHAYFENKLALVTGGSEGIGRAVALDLAGAGAHVIIAARNPEKLDRTLKELQARKRNAQQILAAVAMDVTDYSSTQKKIDQIVKSHGVPDFLINCAGAAHPGYISDLEVGIYREMMDLNYFGIVHTAKAMIPHFLAAKKGHIVNTSSMAGFLGLFGYTGYCASKYAVVGFSQALRHELKPFGIKVSVLCPPNTKTPGLERENQWKPAEVLKIEEKAKVVTAEEVSMALLKSLPKGKFMIIPTFDGNLAYVLSRFFPWLIDQFIKRPAAIN
jgi:3-dehydrosphinganine reductase